MSLLQTIARATKMFIEQRRSMREKVNFPAWIDIGDGSSPRGCTVLDVSEGGARIMLSSAFRLPETFWLVLSRDGTRRRHCRLAWRSDEQLGVEYLAPPRDAWRPKALN